MGRASFGEPAMCVSIVSLTIYGSLKPERLQVVLASAGWVAVDPTTSGFPTGSFEPEPKLARHPLQPISDCISVTPTPRL